MTIIEMEDSIKQALQYALPRVDVTCDILPQATADYNEMCKSAGEKGSVIYIAWGGEDLGNENVGSRLYDARQLFYIFILSKKRREGGILEFYDVVKSALYKEQFELISGDATPAQDAGTGVYMAVLVIAKMDFFPH